MTDVGRLHRLGWRGTETDLKAFVRAEFARIGLADDAAVAEALAGDEALARRLAGRGATLTTFVDAVVGALIANRTSDAWERYVAGDRHALSANARAGLATFVDVGCAACHGGRTLGGVSNHVLGAAHPYPPGGIWRAPSLRHAARTAPYLHDDSVATLPEVARLMAYHELGTRLTEDQVAAIVTFLEEIGDVRS